MGYLYGNYVSRETFSRFRLWTQDKVSRETFSPKILYDIRETFQ